jgi:hypothetical protein
MPQYNEFDGKITHNKMIRFINNPAPVDLVLKNTEKSIRAMPVNEITLKYEVYANKLEYFIDLNKGTEYLQEIERIYGLK